MRTLFQRGLLLACLIVPVAARSDNAAQLKIDNFKFGPEKLTVAKGTEVTGTNQDDIPHSILLTALGVRSQVLDTDKAFTYRFEKAGTFSYVCGLHPFMHGQVVAHPGDQQAAKTRALLYQMIFVAPSDRAS